MIRMVQIYIYKNLHNKIFIQIFEMGVVYEEEISELHPKSWT